MSANVPQRAVGVSCLLALSAVGGAGTIRWQDLPGLPDAHGYAGMFAGVTGGHLVCGGGSNFPDLPLAQGGKKVWHSRIFSLEGTSWKHVGDLPAPWGYGISGTWRDAIVLAGGSNASRHYTECHLLRQVNGNVVVEPLPGLPIATANGTGCMVGDRLYVAGGQETPTSIRSLSRFFSLDLGRQGSAWQEHAWPEGAPGRILAVSASADGWFYLISGAELRPNEKGQAERAYLRDAWRYRPEDGWERLPDLPRAAAAAPSPAAVLPSGALLLHSGVWPEYLAAVPAAAGFPGFSRAGLIFDPKSRTWCEVEEAAQPWPARVTAPSAQTEDRYVIFSGESAPGIRTPTVLSLNLRP